MPANSAGARLKPNFLDGPGMSGRSRARVFQAVDRPPATAETAAARIHVTSQRGRVDCARATSPATVATLPTSARPKPENVENAEAFSIVSRMKRRSAMARACRAGASGARGRVEELGGMSLSISESGLLCQVLCAAEFRGAARAGAQ